MVADCTISQDSLCLGGGVRGRWFLHSKTKFDALRAFQGRAVLSKLAVTTRVLSGLNTAE